MIVDTHCHYNLEPLYNAQTPDSWQEHWHRAQSEGVGACMIVGTTIESSTVAIALAATTTNLTASVGIHPYRVAELLESGEVEWETYLKSTLTQLTQLSRNQQVSAIGEIGLDYYRMPKSSSEHQAIRTAQKQLVAKQLSLAKSQGLPVVLHVRDRLTPEERVPDNAYWDMLSILEESAPLTHPVILHCVSGPAAYVQAALDLGCYIGVAANCTYPSAMHIRKLIKQAPPDRILLETDAPYLPPQSNRGKICEPWMISETAEYLEKELGVPNTTILANTKRVFPTLIPVE